MKRASSIVCAAVAIAAVCLSASAAWAVPQAGPRVTLVLATGLTWSDITATGTPTLWRIAGTGAVGNLNSRIRNREAGEPPSPLEGALDLSAGNWATPNYAAAAAFGVAETADTSSTGADLYARVTGRSPSGSAICYAGLPALLAANSDPAAEVSLGTLGQAVRDGGGVTGAVGNSDAGSASGPVKFERPAAVTAMDAEGLVSLGDVSEDLLAPSSQAPYGERTDVSALQTAVLDFETRSSAHGGPSLLVIDPGDAYRAKRFAPEAAPDVALAQHDAALAELDAVVAFALERRGTRDTVVVVSQALANDSAGGLQGFGPVFAVGPGLGGYLTSASTHRPGIVTNPDVTAHTLAALGIGRPVQVMGSALESDPAPADGGQRIARMSALNTTAVSVDGARASVAEDYIRLYAVILLLSAALIILWDRLSVRLAETTRRVLIALLLLLLSVPLAGWAMFLVIRTLGSPQMAVALLLASSAILWALGAAVWRYSDVRAAIAALLLLTVGLLVIDQLLGAPLSIVNFMGYSPLQSARYYGLGNEAAGLITGAAIVGTTLLLDRQPGARWALGLRQWGIAVIGALVVVSAAAPFLGANVGVAVWGTGGFIVAWALLNGRKVGWKTALAVVLVAVLLIAGFAAIDLANRTQQTHLGRSLVSAQQGGASQLWVIVARKIQTNARVLADTQWIQVLFAIAAFLALLWLFRPEVLAGVVARNPAFKAALVATMTASVLAFFTEDSGIIVPAYILLSTGAALAALALSAAFEEPLPR